MQGCKQEYTKVVPLRRNGGKKKHTGMFIYLNLFIPDAHFRDIGKQ